MVDRADTQFAVKDECRGMSKPGEEELRRMRWEQPRSRQKKMSFTSTAVGPDARRRESRLAGVC